MIKIDKLINLEQLDKELQANGLNGELNENGNLIAVGLAENSTITEEELKIGIATHNAVFKGTSVDEKLASVGLNLTDLKSALGL